MGALQFSKNIIQGLGLKLAKMAGYDAAVSNRQYAPASRIGTNPNSQFANQQRTRLSFEGEQILKNTSFAINYVAKRSAYCSGSIKYSPNTGDAALDIAVSEYLAEQFKRMGVYGQSMEDVFTLVGDVFLPEKGDGGLQWYRDENGMRLIPISADRIGEQFVFTNPYTKDGLTYTAGIFLQGPDIAGFRVYDRYSESVYVNPHFVPAWDMIFFKDGLTDGQRGVTAFAGALEVVRKRARILGFSMDTMQVQSKTAAIVSNNSGQPYEYSYQQDIPQEGGIEYVQTYADGAIERYQFNGDSYQFLKAEHPTDTFIHAMENLDAEAALAMRFPYGFLFSGAGSGGAPFRGDFEIAGKEIERIRNRVHRPRLDIISFITIMDGVERGKLPARPNITKGEWRFGSLPSVDAFRDDKADIMNIRAGIDSRDGVIKRKGGTGFAEVLAESKKEAVMIAMATQDANKELQAAGYNPVLTVNDLAQSVENPQAVPSEIQSQQAGGVPEVAAQSQF